MWLHLVSGDGFRAHKLFFGYITRSTATNSPRANDALLIYPIIGMFVGVALVTIIIFVSSRRNKRHIGTSADTTDPVWIMLAVLILSIAGGAIYGHHFG
ncbi:MAG TPA: hypothetical protein VFZ58_01135 [Candidatus Saccharimonadales bacterium]